MKSRALPEFWNRLNALPPEIQRPAQKNFLLWQDNPSLKSLGFKKIRGDVWSVRAGSGFRALAALRDGSYVWFWIGRHDEYERMIADL